MKKRGGRKRGRAKNIDAGAARTIGAKAFICGLISTPTSNIVRAINQKMSRDCC